MIFQVINNYNTALGGAQRIAIELHKAAAAEGISSQLIGLCCEPAEPVKDAVTIKLADGRNLVVVANNDQRPSLFKY